MSQSTFFQQARMAQLVAHQPADTAIRVQTQAMENLEIDRERERIKFIASVNKVLHNVK